MPGEPGPLVLVWAALIDGAAAEPVRGRAVVVVQKSQSVMAAHVASFRLARAAGVRIAAGADSRTPFNRHGSLVPELALMVEHGMTPIGAIRAATEVAADLLGLGDVIGRIAPGYAADLVAVAGDPAERIQALDEVRRVFVNGRPVPPGDDA